MYQLLQLELCNQPKFKGEPLACAMKIKAEGSFRLTLVDMDSDSDQETSDGHKRVRSYLVISCQI